jgi:hypothetical protein
MHERDTRLLTELPANSAYTRFILFPLPSGDSFQEYLKEVLARLPEKSLQTVSLGGRDFVLGSISDLPFLFPDATSAPKQGVSVPLHPQIPPVNSRSH